jgi:glycosyltransferase involved in cell wall biosynthesis
VGTLGRPLVAIVSFRLGTADGVSVAATHWALSLRRLGYRVRTVAGTGVADRLVPSLAIDAPLPPTPRELDAALGDADLVAAENICSLPLNPTATAALSSYLQGRPAILHHHDLPWQRPHFAHLEGWPPDDPAWVHVTINQRSQAELADRSIPARTVYGAIADNPRPGRRARTRRRLRLAPTDWLVLQPSRAIERKNVPAGVALAEALGATYWLTGPAEEGYQHQLASILAAARCPIRRGLPAQMTMADAYAAADAVVFPSTWEGFGIPVIESALHRRPVAVGRYPVAAELASFGFRWFPADDPTKLGAWLKAPDHALLDHNQTVARRHFGPQALQSQLREVLHAGGWWTADPDGPRSPMVARAPSR